MKRGWLHSVDSDRLLGLAGSPGQTLHKLPSRPAGGLWKYMDFFRKPAARRAWGAGIEQAVGKTEQWAAEAGTTSLWACRASSKNDSSKSLPCLSLGIAVRPSVWAGQWARGSCKSQDSGAESSLALKSRESGLGLMYISNIEYRCGVVDDLHSGLAWEANGQERTARSGHIAIAVEVHCICRRYFDI